MRRGTRFLECGRSDDFNLAECRWGMPCAAWARILISCLEFSSHDFDLIKVELSVGESDF